MKVLSLKQPFAELVVSGKKTIELRNWNTNFRGRFLVHASKIPNYEWMEKFGFSDLPVGKIVGVVELSSVKEYRSDLEHGADRYKHLADSSWGRYGFVLEDAKRIDGPSVNGKLNFWELDYEI